MRFRGLWLTTLGLGVQGFGCLGCVGRFRAYRG